MTSSGAKKLDIPFRTDAEILDLVTQFEACRWPYERWTHRAHLAVAAVYLKRVSFSDALTRIRQNIQTYTHPHNPGGYHETITVLFMSLVSAYLRENGYGQTLTATVDQLFHLYDMKTPLEFYSPARLWSADAKEKWIEPDLKALPASHK